MTTGFHNPRLAGEAVDAARWPRLAASVAATPERPSVRTAIAARRG
ncbi:hypothetical protein [Methylobacterium crusticola]|nr:hypothetical protein [Methylobacterium crusticola]